MRVHDSHNVSYTSSRPGQGTPARRDSASALLYVPEIPMALDLVSKEGTIIEADLCTGSREKKHALL